MNLHIQFMVEQERRREELAAIQQEQLLRASGITTAPWAHRQLAALGDRLVELGTWLQRRYAHLSVSTSPGLLPHERQTPCPE